MMLWRVLASFPLLWSATASPGSEAFERLKQEAHLLGSTDVKARLEDVRLLLGAERQQEQQEKKIEHFVVLLLENHAADNTFGCMDLPGFDGIPPGGRQIPKDPSDPSKGVINVSCGSASYVCKNGPGYDTWAGKFAPGAQPYTYPYGEQDDKYSALHGADGVAVQMFSGQLLPVKRAFAQHFGVFNKLFCGVPSASTPNHFMVQSATSCGLRWNVMYNDTLCGGHKDTFPQLTIYDSLYAHNVSFSLFMNSTCGLPYGNGSWRPACHGESPHTPDAGSPIPSPDVAMEGVGRYKSHFRSQEEFYSAAANGTLPAFSWFMPHDQACDHPCHDMAKGERIAKDVYEAVRAGPGWNKTLLLIVYDDAGGYYDHVVPPHEGVPADEAPCRCPKADFDFRRLGLRTTGTLVSPWLPAGSVFQEPKGPTNTSQFDLTSVPATVKTLFNLSAFLTKRDAWAGSFEELLSDSLRTDAPLHLPEPPPPAKPWKPPYPPDWPPTAAPKANELGEPAVDAEGAHPRHCSLEKQVCIAAGEVSVKRRKLIVALSKLLHVPEPDIDLMSSHDAELWLAEHWDAWMGYTPRPTYV